MAIRYKNPQTGEYEVIKIPVMKGDQGHAGIHVGTDAPPTTDVKLWFDPSDTDNDVDLANRLDTTLTACYDYMGNDRGSIKAAADANVDWLLGEINTAHYEGQHITATDTIEGRSKSAILKGQTLVNLMTKCKDEYVVRYHDINNPNNNVANISMMKPNTEYTLFYKAKYRTQGDGAGTAGGLKIATSIEQGFMGARHSYTTEYKQYIQKITTSSVVDCFVFASNGSYFAIKECVLLEGDYTNVDIPFFEGMASVKAPVLHSVGKNLYNPDTARVVGINNQDVNNKVDVKANTEYTFYANGHSWTQVILHNNTGQITRKLGQSSTSTKVSFTTTNDEIQATLVFFYGNNTVIENVDFTGIQLEYGAESTPYEPYKSNILTVNEDVELRGIKDTKYFNGSSIGKNFTDVLDCINGELKIQTNKVIMDGNKQPILSVSKGNVSIFKYKPNDMLIDSSYDGGNIFICDKLKFVSALWEKDEEGYCYSNNDGIMFSISNNKFTDINEYLSQNPITFIYPLAQESIKTVDLSDNHVYSYKDVTHYDCSSEEGSLVPTLSIDVPTNLSALVTKQRQQIRILEEENKELNQELELAIASSEENDNELLAQSFELDFRLMEVEFALDLPMAATFRLGGKAMAMTPYEMAKKLILADNYDRADMEHKLDVYVSKKRMTEAERQELIQLMDEKEGVITVDPIEPEIEESDVEHEAVTIPLH